MARTDMFVTDLDGTLLGDDEALARFSRWWQKHRGQMKLVYASGRFCDSVEASMRRYDLPRPDAIIGGVGTEIRLFPQGTKLGDWERSWWPLWDARRVRETLARFAELTRQPSEFQSEFKASYHVYDASCELLAGLRLALASKDISADLIYSSNRNLDIVPLGVNKGTAAMYLANRWQLPLRAILVASDSGNDRSLFRPHWRGIVVANSQPELTAFSGPTIYCSKLPFADGVLDGLRHWLGTECQHESEQAGRWTPGRPLPFPTAL